MKRLKCESRCTAGLSGNATRVYRRHVKTGGSCNYIYTDLSEILDFVDDDICMGFDTPIGIMMKIQVEDATPA